MPGLDPVVTPEIFAQSLIEDYGIGHSYHTTITKSIQEQLSDYKAHSATLSESLETGWESVGGGKMSGILKDDEAHFWEVWRKHLTSCARRLPLSKVERETPSGRAKKRRKVMKGIHGGVAEGFIPIDVHEIEFDEDKTREEMRILIRVCSSLWQFPISPEKIVSLTSQLMSSNWTISSNGTLQILRLPQKSSPRFTEMTWGSLGNSSQ